jgi:hypothetical protein
VRIVANAGYRRELLRPDLLVFIVILNNTNTTSLRRATMHSKRSLRSYLVEFRYERRRVGFLPAHLDLS